MYAEDMILALTGQYPDDDMSSIIHMVMSDYCLKKVTSQLMPALKANLTSRNMYSNRIREAVSKKMYWTKVLYKGKEVVCLYKVLFDVKKKGFKAEGIPILPVSTSKGKLYYSVNCDEKGIRGFTAVASHVLDRIIQRSDNVPVPLSERCYFLFGSIVTKKTTVLNESNKEVMVFIKEGVLIGSFDRFVYKDSNVLCCFLKTFVSLDMFSDVQRALREKYYTEDIELIEVKF